MCGIDEAGRGPCAGPLVVAGVKLTESIKGLNDSKKLSEKKRETLFDEIIKKSEYHIVFTHAKEIDEIGLSKALKNSIEEIMQNIDSKEYLMDGNTTFGIKGLDCMIKADGKVAEVSAASILAKVSRDRYMYEIAPKYENYNFQKHKGYGTKTHFEAIKKYGRCEEHRYSFKLKGIDDIDLQEGIQASLDF